MMRRAQPWLGTLVEISIVDTLEAALIEQAFQAAFSVIGRIHHAMSFHTPDSMVSKINAAPVGARIALDQHTYAVIAAALRVSEASHGLFDIRVAQQLLAWEYLPRHAFLSAGTPAYLPHAIAWKLCHEGARYVLEKLRNDQMDLGGIAKGYAVDQAIAALQRAGIGQASVNAGGDLRVIGDMAFEVGIRSPAAPGSIAKSITLKNQALATSGTYFSAKTIGASKLSALVDGSSGEAVISCDSISVRATECIWADALCKVVAASADPKHPSLRLFSADAFIIGASHSVAHP
jgi:thiamine biosynthesis lipoprotein